MVSKYLGKNTPLYLEHFNREEKKIMLVTHSCDVYFIFC